MTTKFTYNVILSLAMGLGSAASLPANAQSEASALSAISAMPLASVVLGAIEVTARGTVYVLERVSDGAQASVEVLGRGVAGASIAAGTLVTVSVIGAGIVLSAAGEVVAFVPNALGRALLHSERVTL
jgi:hypothetical protein